jgi:hypothetical protein
LGRVVRKRRESRCGGACIFSARGGHADVCWSRKRNNFAQAANQARSQKWAHFGSNCGTNFGPKNGTKSGPTFCRCFYVFLPGRNRIPNMSRFRFRKTVQKVGPCLVPLLGPKVVPCFRPKMVHVLKNFDLSRRTALLFRGTHKSRLYRRGACELGGGRGRVRGRR